MSENKEKIIEILLDNLSYAYCDNCGTEDCDMCYRKYQNWSLGRGAAESIADKILETMEK